MSATNVASERSFSALRRIKSYLHSTMHQQRLNHLMTSDIASEFVGDPDHRLKNFGNPNP